MNMGWKQVTLGVTLILAGFAVLSFDLEKWWAAWDAVTDRERRSDEAWRERERKTFETFMKHRPPGSYREYTKDPLWEKPIASEEGKSIHKGERWGTSKADTGE